MLIVKDKDRLRILSAVATRGAAYKLLRVLVITASLAILLAVPLSGLVRLDLWAGHHLLLFERVDALTAIKGFVVAVAVLWGITFTTNLIVGRFFCGWGCPVGYVGRLGEDVDKAKKSRLRMLLQHASGAGFVATFVGAMMLWWVDPLVMVEGSTTAKLVTAGVFLTFAFGGFLHAFVWRFGFCRQVCPIGLYYKLVTSSTPIGIQFNENPSPCIECGACEKICPVDLDPKHLGETFTTDDGQEEHYGDAECIRCGDCVEACRMIFKGREGETPPLRFGRVHHDAPTGAGAPEPPVRV